MMGWTLPDVHKLSTWEYNDLVKMLNEEQEEAERRSQQL